MPILDPYKIPLESINLIEASAGTGKSWTVTFLYLRLILEKGFTVDQILVVTFTDAATKELRDAVRVRLTEALEVFSCSAEVFQDNVAKKAIKTEYIQLLEQLVTQGFDKALAVNRLQRAKLSIDEAAIFTIHSFCQRVLREHAFEASLPFESELMDDDKTLMQALTDDFWRRRFASAPQSLVFKIQQKSITPDALLKDVRFVVGKPYLTLCKPEDPEVLAEQWGTLENLFKTAVSTWQKQGDEIIGLLSNPETLAAKGYYKGLLDCKDKLFTEMNKVASTETMPSNINKNKIFSWLGVKAKTKINIENIEHPFFQQWQDFLDLWLTLDKRADDFISQIRVELLQFLQENLPAEKQKRGVLSYDDLLLQLDNALQNQASLALDLRQKYPVAMIDEFQDTDPIQYRIFSTIYSTASDAIVFFVGDPKQAIYSFRGGDIHTYTQAKKNTRAQYTLDTNWRSHPDLIAAFNTLYGSSDNPFIDNSIAYQAVNAGDLTTQSLTLEGDSSPLRLWNHVKSDEKQKIDSIRQEIAHAVAGDIATVLNAAEQGNASVGDKPIAGGDIAILVRSHTQGDLIKSALNQRHIPSVQSSKDSIYETHEAQELLHLLSAIVEPQREDNVRRALVTDMLAYRAQDLMGFEQDPNAWEEILLKMHNWHYQWKDHGFLVMMRHLMQSQQVHQRLLAYTDGERRLTNLLQLSELIHQQSQQQLLGMEEVLRWLKQQRQNSQSSERELRLESDENLVKIVTIHKSKGLEYPIIYCPFVGISGGSFKDKIYSFYKDDNAYLEIGSPDAEEHKAIKIAEERAEDARLLYVALTRAKYQCTIVTMPEKISGTPDKTALGWLLSDGQEIKGSKTSKKIKEKADADFYQAYAERLSTLSQSPHISLNELPNFDAGLCYQAPANQQQLSAKQFSANIKAQAQVSSFSGLTAGTHSETPDYDSAENNLTSAAIENTQSAVKADEFPRGMKAGSALHEMMEHLDFSAPLQDQTEIVDSALDNWDFEQKHQSAALALVQSTLQAELFDGFSLSHLHTRQRLDEMEFYLPLKRLNIEDLQQVLFKHLPQQDPHWQLVRDAINTLSFEQVQGYLIGFIDLIFEHQGKYYLADYKSNSLTDYDMTRLFSAMSDSHYYLQYLLYSVALHRYLKKRMSDYQWDSHIGGVYYLFMRGMTNQSSAPLSATTPAVKTTAGVFFDKPSAALIEALDGLFVQEASHV